MMTTVDARDWTANAKCRGQGDAMFPQAVDQRRARALCDGCPVLFACLAEALDGNIEWGIWGGTTERERRAILRQRPDVSSWRTVLLGGQPSRAR
jgi:WhiB family redox-sensing transcriptional regulator